MSRRRQYLKNGGHDVIIKYANLIPWKINNSQVYIKLKIIRRPKGISMMLTLGVDDYLKTTSGSNKLKEECINVHEEIPHLDIS